MTADEALKVPGRINSYESCGTVDGPGLRFVVFLQGCPLRCLYCHNPESWEYGGGRKTTAGEVFEEIRKYKNFMRVSGGGVTLSGGEPLSRTRFVEALLTLCRAEGIHTVVDTSGFVTINDALERIVDLTDLFLLDVKSINASIHQIITGESNDKTMAFAEYLAEKKKPIILRYVLVPDLNDREHCLRKLAKWIAKLGNVEKVELLPFHKMGEFKWEQYGLPYRLTHTREPDLEQVEKIAELLRSYGLVVE
ncbi:MAG TPA: pyruvate formate-lyase-activating protein [Pontiella sp.]